MMGWLAVLSCAPLVGSAWDPPLWLVLVLWILTGAGGAYQLAVAFVQALRPETRARAFGVAQSGLYAVQGLGILARGGGRAGDRGAARRRPGWPGGPDRGHHARHELDPSAGPADPGAAGRGDGGGCLTEKGRRLA